MPDESGQISACIQCHGLVLLMSGCNCVMRSPEKSHLIIYFIDVVLGTCTDSGSGHPPTIARRYYRGDYCSEFLACRARVPLAIDTARLVVLRAHSFIVPAAHSGGSLDEHLYAVVCTSQHKIARTAHVLDDLSRVARPAVQYHCSCPSCYCCSHSYNHIRISAYQQPRPLRTKSFSKDYLSLDITHSRLPTYTTKVPSQTWLVHTELRSLRR